MSLPVFHQLDTIPLDVADRLLYASSTLENYTPRRCLISDIPIKLPDYVICTYKDRVIFEINTFMR